MGRIKGYFSIRVNSENSVHIEVESKKKNVEIFTTLENLKVDIYNSGLSACRCEELISAVNRGISAGHFRRCR